MFDTFNTYIEKILTNEHIHIIYSLRCEEEETQSPFKIPLPFATFEIPLGHLEIEDSQIASKIALLSLGELSKILFD